MCNKLSRRNRPWLTPKTKEEAAAQRKWKKDIRQGHNRYRLIMIDVTNISWEHMVGDNTRGSAQVRHDAEMNGKLVRYRPAVMARHAKLERYFCATNTGRLRG